MSDPVSASCPSCGAPLQFKVGHSRAAVCGYCHSLVARRGQDFEAVGKVADLIPTGSRLAKGLEGRLGEHRLQLMGRLQYQWAQGAWDEWYVSLDDGRWGWLAEAQGRYYLTFPDKLPEVPPYGALVPGASFDHPQHGRFVLSDKKTARIAGVEGEVPDQIAVGDDALTADFDGPKRLFATVDYSGNTPLFFIGREVTLEQLHLSPLEEKPQGRAPAADKLKCPNCSAPVELRVPDQAVRAVCESCGAMLDTSQGALRLLEVLQKHRSIPPIPLGRSGTLRGRKLQVVGWMRRGCEVEAVPYHWQELLLYEPSTTGFLWLVESDGHWQLAEPISAAEVDDGGTFVSYRQHGFKFFSRVEGKVDEVLGEFYWAVRVGDSAGLSDYLAPPHGLSREDTADEINWSYLTHLEAEELAEAFSAPGLKSRPSRGVGMIQPYPLEKAGSAVNRWCGFGALAVFAIWLVLVAHGRTLVYQHDFSDVELATPAAGGPAIPPPPLAQFGQAPPAIPPRHSFLSPPFALPADRAVEVSFVAQVDNHWAYVDGALVPASGGTSQVFGLESSYYHGYDGDGSWSEGNRIADVSLPAPSAGQYVLRADLQWDPKMFRPPGMTLQVYSGGTSGWALVFALLALGGPLLIMAVHRSGFEKQRWENSTVGGA